MAAWRRAVLGHGLSSGARGRAWPNWFACGPSCRARVRHPWRMLDLFDIEIASGRLKAARWGDPRDPLVLCVHGLSANLASFARLGPAMAGAGRHVVAVD